MTHRPPHLASQQQIESWAAIYNTRSQLPNVVRRLVRSSVPSVQELIMPGDEHVDFSGYDGIVTSPVQTPFVPLGRSVWEFGTSDEPQDKANKDYDKRTLDSLGVEKLDTTFVFVTPRRWPGASKWAQTKAALGEWKSVIALSSSDLYAAFENSPRDHIWFSELLNIPASGVSTLAAWWDRYTTGSNGLITPELLITGRSNVSADLLREFLDSDSAHIWINAPTSDDVIAFVAAVILTSEPDIREQLLDRALVVFDPGALAYLDSIEGLLILVPFDESLMRQADLVTGHHVVLHTTGAVEMAIPLPPIPIGNAGEILKAAGVDQERVTKLSRALNKSLPLFKQHVAGTANLGLALSTPLTGASQLARRAWLMGAWNFAQKGDTSVFTTFTGQTPESAQESLNKLSSGPAPVLTHVGEAWKVFDSKASFLNYSPAISAEDLKEMEGIVQEVLGAVDPSLDLPRDQRWRANIDGKVKAHSTDLRRGVSQTLALFGSDGDNQTLVGGASVHGWAELTVRALLQRANEDETGKLWESLFDVISLLAEAAPDQFLDELEAAINPGGVLEGRIFEDSDDFMSPSSPHVYLLWSLETLAWSPDYFGRAVTLLVQLARTDPGGKLSNRPIGTLTNIFLPWHPQTGASLASRNKVLSKICAQDPDTAWLLLQALLPEPHASSMEGSGPEFRSWKRDANGHPVTMASYFEAVQHILDLSVELAAADYSRLPDLVDKLDDLPPQLRAQVLVLLEDASAANIESSLRDSIWSTISSMVRRHRQYPDADWSLDEEQLVDFDILALKFEPEDAIERSAWLFDHTPDIGGGIDLRDDYERYDEEVRRRQVQAAESVYIQSGPDGIVQLSKVVASPWSVGVAAAKSPIIELDINGVAALVVDENDGVRQFAWAFISKKLGTRNDELIALSEQHGDNPLIRARLLRMMDDLPMAWEAARLAGEEVDHLYWSEFETMGRGAFALVNETAEHLRRNGRHAKALDLMAIYSHRSDQDLDSHLIVRLLDELIVSKDDPERRLLSQYDLAALLEYVRKAGQIDTEALGLLEWRLLPALGRSSDIAALQALLASSPAFFVQIISYLYRRKDSTESDEKHPSHVVQNAWDLLHRWSVIPGSNVNSEEVDEQLLRQWVEETRTLLADAGRLEVGEAHIGQVFAHSKSDGDLWPTLAVRNFLEDSSSTVIDRNFSIGVTNLRGVVTRSIGEGGDQERALVRKYEDYASLANDEWPKTARLLRKIADHYKREALRNDETARREQEGFDR